MWAAARQYGRTRRLPQHHLAASLARGMGALGTIWEWVVYSICKRFFCVFVFSLPTPNSHAQ